MDLFKHAKKSKKPSRSEPSNGQVGTTGSGTQAEFARSYDEFVQAVKDYVGHRDSIAMAFHPDATELMIQTKKGWVRVTKGEAGYQLNSGGFVKV